MRRDSHAGYRLGIVNPLSLVGGELKSILRERGLPYQTLSLLGTRSDDAGALTEVGDEAAIVTAISEDELEGLDLVFFCGSGEENLPWIERAPELRFIAVDLSQPSASDGVPVVAGVNSASIDSEQAVLVSPHPIATPLIMLLDAIRKQTRIEICAATVIQPASEFGQKGIDELLQQTIHVLNVESFPKEVFDRQLAFNLYPAADGARDEQYAVKQVRAVLGKEVPLSLAVAQGTTFHSHTFSVFLRTASDFRLEETAGFDFPVDDAYGTIDASGRDQVLVGRVHQDAGMPGAWWLWLVSDNVRRASALNAVMVAEEVLGRLRPIVQ
jgi:aspartate-semialdehyde dehydrogenase